MLTSIVIGFQLIKKSREAELTAVAKQCELCEKEFNCDTEKKNE